MLIQLCLPASERVESSLLSPTCLWVVTFAVYAHIVSNINFEYTKEKIVLLLIFSLYR